MTYSQRSAFEVTIARSLKSNLERYLALFSDATAYNQGTFSSEKKRLEGFVRQFDMPLNEARLNIYLNSASLIEAAANLYLSLKTDSDLFEVFSNMNIVQKWCVAPKLLIGQYKFNKKGQLYKDLLNLKQIRNAIVHLKPETYFDGKRIHKGKNPKAIFGNHDFCVRAANLPFKLIENLLEYDRSFLGDAYTILQYKPKTDGI